MTERMTAPSESAAINVDCFGLSDYVYLKERVDDLSSTCQFAGQV